MELYDLEPAENRDLDWGIFSIYSVLKYRIEPGH